MRILLVSPLPPPAGGIATWTKTYLQAQKTLGNHVDIINTAVTGRRVNKFTSVFILDELIRTWRILLSTYRHASGSSYDIVHINTPCSQKGLIRDTLCTLIAKFYRLKVLIHCRCDVTYQIKNSFQYKTFKFLCRRVDKILVLNSVSQKYVHDKCGCESKIIPNYISQNHIRTTPKIISDRIKTVLYAGHVTIEKGCNDILEVARYFPDIKFILAGHLMAEIKSLPRPENVQCTGEVDKTKILQYMTDADVFLFPTHTEGFPNVILEAMAAGLPIISTPVGAIPDMIEKSGGVLIQVGDVKGMVNSLNQLDDASLRKAMSAWNIEKIKSNYLVDIVIDKLLDEYSSSNGVQNE